MEGMDWASMLAPTNVGAYVKALGEMEKTHRNG
jgi:hypothetical protein